MKFLAFDLETAKLENEEDLQDLRSLGISCWAVASYSSHLGRIMTQSGHGRLKNGEPSPRMTMEECRELVMNLETATLEKNFILLTHNGIGFDLKILAEESGMFLECSSLARNSVDTMLHFLCLQGFPVGLNAIAKGMGLSGKTEGMSGGLAPEMWKDGKFREVLEYVQQDVITTLEIATEVLTRGKLTWITAKGKTRSVRINKWLTMREALRLPRPNTDWMDNPLTRESLIEWMEE